MFINFLLGLARAGLSTSLSPRAAGAARADFPNC